MTRSMTVRLSIPCSAEFVSVARLSVSGVASRMHFSIEEIEDIKISVSEACTNVIQHAYGDMPNVEKNLIEIIMDIQDEQLIIQVKDDGIGFDLSTIGTMSQKQKSKEKLGLGLGLTFIQSLMDSTKFISEVGKGTTIHMEKSAPKLVAKTI